MLFWFFVAFRFGFLRLFSAADVSYVPKARPYRCGVVNFVSDAMKLPTAAGGYVLNYI